MKKSMTLIILNIAISAIFIGLVFVPILITVFVYPMYNNAWELVGYAHVTYRHSMVSSALTPAIFLVALLGLNLAFNTFLLAYKKVEVKGWVNLFTLALSIASFVLCYITSDIHVRALAVLPFFSLLIP